MLAGPWMEARFIDPHSIIHTSASKSSFMLWYLQVLLLKRYGSRSSLSLLKANSPDWLILC